MVKGFRLIISERQGENLWCGCCHRAWEHPGSREVRQEAVASHARQVPGADAGAEFPVRNGRIRGSGGICFL